jgi:tetratricopeptide (TPR) repeat protein
LTKAKLLEKANQGQDALIEYQWAAEHGHLPDAYVGRARLLLDRGANREAIHDLELARKLDKNRCDALALMGKGNLGLQVYKVAEGQLREASHCLPKDPEVRYNLAEACTGAHDFECACSAYREAAQLGIKGDDLGDSYYKLGMCLKQRGSQGAASEAFKKCMEVGTEVQKANCGKELSNLGGFK